MMLLLVALLAFAIGVYPQPLLAMLQGVALG